MKCLVLGGGGFIGSHLSEALMAEGYAVRIFDRPNVLRVKSLGGYSGIEWYEGDFLNRQDIAQAVAGCDIIYHLISTTLPRSSNENPVYDVETNVVGTLHLLEAAKQNKVKKVVFASSGGTIYGRPATIPIKETHPTEPTCSYGIGKLTIENYLRLFHLLHGVDYCILRLANPYGERQRAATAQGAVTVFLDKALRGETVEIWGSGSVIRDYFHVGDAITALLKALPYSGDVRVFNIGSGVGKSLNEILDAIDALLGTPVRRKYLPGRAFDVPVNVLDISKSVELLGWSPQVPFPEGLSRTADWLRNMG
jgi:UDP-glucose 4-epimerase